MKNSTKYHLKFKLSIQTRQISFVLFVLFRMLFCCPKTEEEKLVTEQPALEPIIPMETTPLTSPLSVKSPRPRYSRVDLEWSKLSHQEAVKPVGTFPEMVPFSIGDCDHVSLFLLDALSQCYVDMVKDSFLVIGPCEGPVFLRDVQDCTIVVACQQLRLKNCHRVHLNLSCLTEPIIEKSTEIELSNYSYNYIGLKGGGIHVDLFFKASLSILHNEWNKVYDFNDIEKVNFKIVVMMLI